MRPASELRKSSWIQQPAKESNCRAGGAELCFPQHLDTFRNFALATRGNGRGHGAHIPLLRVKRTTPKPLSHGNVKSHSRLEQPASTHACRGFHRTSARCMTPRHCRQPRHRPQVPHIHDKQVEQSNSLCARDILCSLAVTKPTFASLSQLACRIVDKLLFSFLLCQGSICRQLLPLMVACSPVRNPHSDPHRRAAKNPERIRRGSSRLWKMEGSASGRIQFTQAFKSKIEDRDRPGSQRVTQRPKDEQHTKAPSRAGCP